MTYKAIAYCFYLPITFYIMIWVGYRLYKNGAAYLKLIFYNDLHIVNVTNKILLVGYYLTNLGYAAFTMHKLNEVMNYQEVIAVLGVKIGTIVLALACMHYFNLFSLLMMGKYMNQKNINQSPKTI